MPLVDDRGVGEEEDEVKMKIKKRRRKRRREGKRDEALEPKDREARVLGRPIFHYE